MAAGGRARASAARMVHADQGGPAVAFRGMKLADVSCRHLAIALSVRGLGGSPCEDLDDSVGEAAAPAGVVVAATELPVSQVVACRHQLVAETADVVPEAAFFGACVDGQPASAGCLQVGGGHVSAAELPLLAGPPQGGGSGNYAAE